MSTDATAVVGTPTLPAKGVIKARVRGRLSALVARYNEAQMTAGSRSGKAEWMKDAMNKRVRNKKIADVAAAHGAHDAATLEEKLKAQARYETSMRMHKRHRVDYERRRDQYKDLVKSWSKSVQNYNEWTNKARTEYDEYVKQKLASLAQMKEMKEEIEETKAAMWASVEPRVEARIKEEREEIKEEREELDRSREDGLKFIQTMKLCYEVTQKEKDQIWADEQQLAKDRRQFEQEKRKLDVPKLLATISDLQRQLQTKKKRQRSHREQEERRTIMREEDKKSKENTPPTQTKRQKGSA